MRDMLARTKNTFFTRALALLGLALLAACALGPSPAPTPDMGAMATQLWVEISVKNTLEASMATATPAPTATPEPTPTPNWISTPLPIPVSFPDYPPVYNPASSMEMRYVPAGEFLMGSAESDSSRDVWTEIPQHAVYLDAYWISKTQVTNAMFNACVASGGCSYDVSKATNPRYTDPIFAGHPVVYVSWYMAQTYCEWTGGRLPTEAEWEKAARGPDGQRYPWGTDTARIQFVNAHDEIGNTTPVGAFPLGTSYYGALDMGGNVREWVSDWYDAQYYSHTPLTNPQGPQTGEKKVLKGAAFMDPWLYCRSASRLSHEPASPGAVRGFRCVYP